MVLNSIDQGLLLRCIIYMGIFSTIATAEPVQMSGKTIAILGDQALFKCEITEPQDILQVSWQKEKGGLSVNLATYSKRFGRNILQPFNGRLNLTQTELSKSIITIDRVTLDDEGRYACLFNTFPGGSMSRRSHLTVYVLSELRLEEHGSINGNSFHGNTAVCRATGKPAPSES
nr:PREDICTED: OX-2 membrane glycoprotein-like [Latimeria chalumnae]|eukprot:XP_014353711.1 PREDICTED: OX-2 membrane glycoprotein-like [Latimeria chalumnae]